MTTSLPEMDGTRIRDEVSFPNDEQLLSGVLRPYEKPKTQYLKHVTVKASGGLASAEGEFAIPYSCYIDDTGHLNAVEVTICFNQLMYYLIAKCVQDRIMPEFDEWTMGDYWAKQLPDMLIANYHSSFKRPIDSASFFGEVSFAAFSEHNRRRPVQFIEMPWRFWDNNGGNAYGEVQMALIDPPGARFQAGAA